MRTFFLIYLTFLVSFQILAQDDQYYNPNQRVYWFDIGVKQTIDKETRLPTTTIVRLGTNIKYGTKEDFDKHLWNFLASGRGIAIGPFQTYEQAKFANKFYDLKSAEKDSTLFNSDKTYFWFLVKIKRYKRLKSLALERMPARVAQGSLKDFFTNLKIGLPLDKIAIGPFTSLEEAEEAKRLMRLEE